MRRRLPLALFAALAADGAAARAVPLDYFELPPYSYPAEGAPDGSALKIARKIAEGLDIEINPDPVPLRRLLHDARDRPVVIAALIRTAARETEFQWIGRLCRDPFIMVTRAPNGPVQDLDQARRLGQIAVVSGASNETTLRELGFTNLDPAASIQLEVRRLAEGHDDAWLAPRNGALFAWKAAGYDPAQLRFGTKVANMEVWMAASKPTPKELVKTLRTRFAAQLRQGFVAAATGCGD